MFVSCSGDWKKSVPGTAAFICVMPKWTSSSESFATLKSARRTWSVAPRRLGSGRPMRMFAGLMSRWQMLRTRCEYSTALETGIM